MDPAYIIDAEQQKPNGAAPKIDELETECARVLGFRTGQDHSYCSMAAREWLALWRHVTNRDEPPQQSTKALEKAAMELAAHQERTRTINILRARQDELARSGPSDGVAFVRLNELVRLLDLIEGRI